MVNWGLVGIGDISLKRVAPAIISQPESKLVAVMSPHQEKVRSFGAKFGIQGCYTSIEEMLKDKEIDAVYIAIPVFVHHDLALTALKNEKHVIIEKPMAMTQKECENLVQEAKNNNVLLSVAYYRRFFPKFKEVKDIIEKGIIGDIIQIKIANHSWYNPESNDPKSWRLNKAKSGGGPLWDIGSHRLDILVNLFGIPKTVSAIMSTQTHKYDVEDSCSIIMEMENGAHCIASFNWNSKFSSDEFEILGTLGKISLNPFDSNSIEIHLNQKLMKGSGTEITRVYTTPNHQNVHYPLIDDFVDAIINNRVPIISGIEGSKTNRILSAVEEAAKTGKSINV